jgi:hypothetical protein
MARGRPKGIAKSGGRKKGAPNKFTAQLKDMILSAAELAGNDIEPGGGTVTYLKQQAKDNPGPFMSLLGKVLPTQITGDPDNPLHLKSESDAQFGAVVGALESLARTKSGSAGGESGVDRKSKAVPTNA